MKESQRSQTPFVTYRDGTVIQNQRRKVTTGERNGMRRYTDEVDQ